MCYTTTKQGHVNKVPKLPDFPENSVGRRGILQLKFLETWEFWESFVTLNVKYEEGS